MFERIIAFVSLRKQKRKNRKELKDLETIKRPYPKYPVMDDYGYISWTTYREKYDLMNRENGFRHPPLGKNL